MTNSHCPTQILMVEDNFAHVRLIQEAFKNMAKSYQIDSVDNGVDAIAYLRCEPPFSDASRPALILLDLNLPRKHGREVLAEIKSDPNLKQIPVLILTTSKRPEDIQESYNLHANCYIHKLRSCNEIIIHLSSLSPKAHDIFSFFSKIKKCLKGIIKENTICAIIMKTIKERYAFV